jgi:hypothetical protein
MSILNKEIKIVVSKEDQPAPFYITIGNLDNNEFEPVWGSSYEMMRYNSKLKDLKRAANELLSGNSLYQFNKEKGDKVIYISNGYKDYNSNISLDKCIIAVATASHYVNFFAKVGTETASQIVIVFETKGLITKAMKFFKVNDLKGLIEKMYEGIDLETKIYKLLPSGNLNTSKHWSAGIEKGNNFTKNTTFNNK